MMADDDDDERGAVYGMIARGNRSPQMKPTLVPLCLPQIPHDPTRAIAARNKRLSYGTANLQISCRLTKI
jgi:hypothetical protein